MRRSTSAVTGLTIVSTVLLFVLAGCSYIAHLRAVRFEPLSDNLKGDKTEVKRHWEGIRDGSPHRVLIVSRDGLSVRVSGMVGGSPGYTDSVWVAIDLHSDKGWQMALDKESVAFRPVYKKARSQSPAVLRAMDLGEEITNGNVPGPAHRNIKVMLGASMSVPSFKKAVLDFALVREDTGEKYVYRFHVKRT